MNRKIPWAIVATIATVLVIYSWLNSQNSSTATSTKLAQAGTRSHNSAALVESQVSGVPSVDVAPMIQERSFQDDLPTERLTPPAGAAFSAASAKDEQELSSIIGTQLAEQFWSLLEHYKCERQEGLNLIVYSQAQKSEKLIYTNCFKPSDFDNGPRLIASVTSGVVHQIINLESFYFMYGEGDLRAVTDIDRNGHLELWLDGPHCECDDSDPAEAEECDCTGTAVLEDFEGQLRRRKPT